MREPVGGFAHAAISTMFNPPPTTSTSPPDNSPTSTPRPKNNNNGRIVGAVIGAVVGVVIIVGLVVWAMRRRRRTLRPHEMHGDSAEEKRDSAYKCQELPAEVPPVEPSKGHYPAELQDEREDNDELISPVELPAEGFYGDRVK
jgi:hypothetical protein